MKWKDKRAKRGGARTRLEREGDVGVAALLEGLEADEAREEEERAGAGAPRQGGGAAAAEVAQHAAGQHGEPVGDGEAEVVHLGKWELSQISRRAFSLPRRPFFFWFVFSYGSEARRGGRRETRKSSTFSAWLPAAFSAPGAGGAEKEEGQSRHFPRVGGQKSVPATRSPHQHTRNEIKNE